VQPLIEVRGLSYTYPGGTQALDDVDFDLHPRECVIFFGPNGSGKTTFVLHLNGLIGTDASISVCGLPMQPSNLREIRRHIGLVFQDADDQLFLPTVLEDVGFGPANLGLPREEVAKRVEAALEAVGLKGRGDRAPWQLSAGEKRRAAIAGVLAMDPSVLVLDEPTTFLDPPGRRDLIKVLRALPQARIVVTHDVAFAKSVGTRAVFFHGGKIVADGPVDEIVCRFGWDL
jgi:energy-coupling factor transporter ATP-binding protein EcfA2